MIKKLLPNMSTQSLVIQTEETELPFHINYIPEFVRRKCEVELNETFERKKQAVQELRRNLSSDKATKDICFHDDLLVQYLRHSKYNTNKAFNQLRNYAAIHSKEANIFGTIPDEYFSTKVSTKLINVLPKRCPDGCAVVTTQIGLWDPKEMSIDDVKKLILMTFQQCIRNPVTQISGFKFIHDFAGTSLEHLKHCTPQNLYLFYYVGMHCIPGRYKEIHLVNQTATFRFLWAIIKGFLSDKIRKRVFLHSGTKELLKHFPKSVLPAQYGGEIIDVYAEKFLQSANMEQKKNSIGGQPNFY